MVLFGFYTVLVRTSGAPVGVVLPTCHTRVLRPCPGHAAVPPCFAACCCDTCLHLDRGLTVERDREREANLVFLCQRHVGVLFWKF